MELVITKNTKTNHNSLDTDEYLLETLRTRKKYFFIFDGIKFVSDKEIIGVEPKTYKLIYKHNK
jgi:hypothetical protein